MVYSVAVSPRGDVVQVEVEGQVLAAKVQPMIAEARALADQTGLPILYDMTRAVPGDVTKADLFWMARKLPSLSSPWARRVRVALVHPEQHHENARFWETTFRNLGLDVRAFTDRKEAEGWLQLGAA
jgi:hypothetical protein